MCCLLYVRRVLLVAVLGEQVLQQGPPHVLSECSTYAMVVEEIGQMWGPNHDHLGLSPHTAKGDADSSSASGAGSGSSGGLGSGAGVAVDPALSLLILRFATMIVQKVCSALKACMHYFLVLGFVWASAA